MLLCRRNRTLLSPTNPTASTLSGRGAPDPRYGARRPPGVHGGKRRCRRDIISAGSQDHPSCLPPPPQSIVRNWAPSLAEEDEVPPPLRSRAVRAGSIRTAQSVSGSLSGVHTVHLLFPDIALVCVLSAKHNAPMGAVPPPPYLVCACPFYVIP